MKRCRPDAALTAAVGAALAAAFVLFSYAAAPADETQRVIDETVRGGTVEVDGIAGGIEALPARGDRLRVTARIDRRGSGSARVAVERRAGRIVVCTMFGDPNAGCNAPHEPNRDRTLIFYTVELPAGVAFAAHGVEGPVHVRGNTGALEAKTVDGDVTVESAGGGVDAETVKGRISVTARAARDEPCSLRTVNGRVDLHLLPASGARVSASTVNGAIEDGDGFSFADRPKSFVSHTATGRIGDGAGVVSISTVNGDVRVSAK